MKKIYQKLILLATSILISSNSAAQNSEVIVQLKDASKDSFWFPLTDRLRFGDKGSTAFMSVNWEKGQGAFFGELKINQNAGFASYRLNQDLNLSKFSKIQFEIKGDGRVYKVLIKDRTATLSTNDYSHQLEFKTKKNKVKLIELNLADFKPVYRGVINPNLPLLNTAEITQLGLQINDGKAGQYSLDFKEWIAK
jgi:NADH dehydrogenase [ubiquinone] 1 alpha subcomplex assembly factor 1